MTDAMSNEVYPPRIRRRQGQRISSGDGETVDQEFSSSISEIECEKLQKSSPEKKRTFLRKYKFKDVLVDSKEKNIKPGDHIFYEGSSGVSYYHHLLVTKVERDKITCIDNNGPRFDAEMIKTILKNGQFNLFSLGKVEETETTYAKLKSKNAKIRIWPNELKRYTVEKVIARALKRRGERYYHPTYNNCEHFVIWCICGLSTSLQVTPERHVGYDTLTEVIIEGLCQLIAIKFKKGTIAAEIISDLTEILGCYMRETYLNGEDLGQTFSRKHFAKTVIGLFFRLVGIAVGAWFYGWYGARIGSVMGRFVGYMTASIAIQAIEYFKDPEQFVIANITTDIVTMVHELSEVECQKVHDPKQVK